MSNLVKNGGQNPVERWDGSAPMPIGSANWSALDRPPPGLDPGRIWEAVKRRFWLIGVGFVPVFGLAVSYTILAPRVYKSESTFLLQESGQQPTGSTLDLLKSRRVVAPTVDALDLHVTARIDGKVFRPAEVLDGFDATRGTIEGAYVVTTDKNLVTRVTDSTNEVFLADGRAGDTIRVAGFSFVAPSAPSPDIELAVANFERGVDNALAMVAASRVGREADLIRLTCTTADPQLARDICIGISAGYLDLRTELQLTEATNAREFLNDTKLPGYYSTYYDI